VPTASEHLARARNAEEVAAQVEASYPEWTATALFYAALHYVEAFFYHQARRSSRYTAHTDDHGTRLDEVDSRMHSQYANYRALLKRSMVARYSAVAFTTQEVQNLRRVRFEPLKSWVIIRFSSQTGR
jgi:hypothetical protein